jgi:hypothetical protein
MKRSEIATFKVIKLGHIIRKFVQATYYCLHGEHKFMKHMQAGMGKTRNNTQVNSGYCFS